MRSRILVAAIVLIALAGCAPANGGTSVSPAPSSQSSTPSPTPSETSGDDASASCTRDELTITYTELDASAGHRHALLTFTNTVSGACSVEGYPIVFMGSSEVAAPVGPQATQDAVADAASITLQPGQAATALLTITQAGIVDGCTVASSDHLVVGPPLDHPFVWEDDGRHVPTPAIDSCLEQEIGLLTVRALEPA